MFGPKLVMALCDMDKFPGLTPSIGAEVSGPKVVIISNTFKQRVLKVDLKLTPELEESA